MKSAVLWLRNDLRLHDHAGFRHAEKSGLDFLIPVFILDENDLKRQTFTGLPSLGPYRAAFLRQTLENLKASLRGLGSDLWIYRGNPAEIIPEIVRLTGADTLIYELEDTTYEKRREAALRQALPRLHHITRQERTLTDDSSLPFDISALPDIFTEFREKAEKYARINPPLPPPEMLPPPPEMENPQTDWQEIYPSGSATPDPRTAFPFEGGESAALERLEDYVWKRRLASAYKTTRNGLIGEAYSTKFSPWLANGSLSPRLIYAEIKKFEDRFGPSDETYWIIFELLWRDYFRYVARKFGNRIFMPGGIRNKEGVPEKPDQKILEEWINGQTGEPFCDAGMNELRLTGYLSNRMRQNCASFWCHDLKQPWQAGAEWFEHALIDYDPCSNYGNWMYVAGVGNDPRPDRYFNLKGQAERYDPDGAYRKKWNSKKFS